MRKGVNPEKNKQEKNGLKFHRIIIPVYIPNEEEEYYEESAEVFKTSLNSIFATVNKEITGITVIDNGILPQLSELLQNYLQQGLINKLVKYSTNKGKVFAVLSEARASYESFITIADADVFFFPGWEKAVFEIYRNFPKAGIVSPLPAQNLTFYKNTAVFFDNYIGGKIKYAKKVSDKDCDLFIRGMGNIALHRRVNHKYSWKEKQYFIENNIPAILGANHFVATYRKKIFEQNNSFPVEKFKKGFEEKFMDEPGDQLGYYRLSTVNTYAYHLGNKMEQNIFRIISFKDEKKIDSEDFEKVKSESGRTSKAPYWLRNYFLRVLKKVKKL